MNIVPAIQNIFIKYGYLLIKCLVLAACLGLTLQAESKDTAAQEKLPPHIAVMVEEIKNKSAVLLDVREQHEWEAGHLTFASLAPLSKLKADYTPPIDNKNIKVYIHCRSGNRVRTAKPLLQQAGFKRVIMLKEKFAQLKALGITQTDNQEKPKKAKNN